MGSARIRTHALSDRGLLAQRLTTKPQRRPCLIGCALTVYYKKFQAPHGMTKMRKWDIRISRYCFRGENQMSLILYIGGRPTPIHEVKSSMVARAATALRRAHLSAPLPRSIPCNRPVLRRALMIPICANQDELGRPPRRFHSTGSFMFRMSV